jgi:hypothetical protein
MGRKVIVESSQTTTTTGSKFNRGNNDNMGRKVIVESSQTTTTTTGNKYARGGNDNMGRQVIIETSQTTTTTGGNKFSRGNNDNMGRKVIVESSTRKGETSQGSSRRATHDAGYGMSKKVIVETTTTTTKGGYGAKNGYQIENVALNKSGNEKDWKSGRSSKNSGMGSSYYKEEKKVTKVSGRRGPWEVDQTNGDEVFAGRHPSDEEVSTGGAGYSKYSVKKEIKYQPSSTTKGATSTKVSKFSVQRTGS